MEFLINHKSRQASDDFSQSLIEFISDEYEDNCEDKVDYFDYVLLYLINFLMNEKIFCEEMGIDSEDSTEFDCYIGSFCDASVDEEVLPLWNLYGDQGRGVRMEWSASDFIEILKEHNDQISLHRVQYFTHDELSLRISDRLRHIKEFFISFSEKFPKACRAHDVLNLIGKSLYEMVIRNAVVAKRKEYQYENEFRVILLKERGNDNLKSEIYESRGSYIHRYLEIYFPAEVLKSVVCGPVSDARLLGSIRRYLSSPDISRRFARNKKRNVDEYSIQEICEKINKNFENYNIEFIKLILEKGIDNINYYNDIENIERYLSEEAIYILNYLKSNSSHFQIHILPIPEIDIIRECNNYIQSIGGVVIHKGFGYVWWYPECEGRYCGLNVDCISDCINVCRLSSDSIPAVRKSSITFRG